MKSCTATVRDPVTLGEKAKVTVKCPVGPTCDLIYHYPNGSVADLPNPTHPNPGWWQWTWTVPANARAGEARGTAECIEDGVRKAMDTDFTIKAAPWSIRVNVQSPFDHTTLPEIGLLVTVTIVGTMPENSSTALQDVFCQIDVTPEGGGLNTGYLHMWWNNDEPPIAWNWQTTFGASDIGTASWTMRCRNDSVDPAPWKYDSGTFEIT